MLAAARRPAMAALCMLAMALAAAPALAQSDALRALAERYRGEWQEGDRAAAITTARQAAELAASELGEAHRFTAAQRLNLAGLLAAASSTADADAAYRAGIAALAMAAGPGHPDVARARRDYAGFLQRSRQFEPAARELQLAHDDLAAAGADAAVETIDTAAELAGLYRRLGRFEAAGPLYEQVLDGLQERYGTTHPRVAGALNNLALLRRDTGDYAEAERLLQRAFAILKDARGPEHPSTASALDNLGTVRLALGRYSEAEADLRKALELRRRLRGPRHPETLQSLNNLSTALLKLGRPLQAEPLQREALALAGQLFGPDHPETATAQANLAAVEKRLGRLAQAETLYREALATRRGVYGPAHPRTAAVLNNLAETLRAAARYEEAEDLLQEALVRTRDAFGERHPAHATALHNLGNLWREQGRDDEAEQALKKALAIREEELGFRHADTADSLEALGALRKTQGRYGEAEPYYLRAMEIREAVLGARHPGIADSLNNLALLLSANGHEDDGRGMLVRAQRIYEQALGPDHPAVADVLSALADFDRRRQRSDLAIASLQTALLIRTAAFEPEHPMIALSHNDLGGFYLATNRAEDAIGEFRTAFRIATAAFGPQHRQTTQIVNNLASAELAAGRTAQAITLYRQALAAQIETVGDDHPDTATTLGNLALALDRAGREDEALDTVREAAAILERRYLGPAAAVQEARESERLQRRDSFLYYVDLTLRAAADPAEADSRIAEAFRSAQMAQSSQAGGAIARTALRFAAGDGEQAGMIRKRQDMANNLTRLEARFIVLANDATAMATAGAQGRLGAAIFSLRRRLEAADRRIAKDFPRYAELTNPAPLQLTQARALLGPGEALLVLLVDREKSYVWAVTPERSSAHIVRLGAKELNDIVAELREGIDLSSTTDLRDLPRFDTPLAHDLYARLLAPVMPTLAGSRHLFFVPDGALTAMPLGLLVTEPQEAPPRTAEDYRKVPWLAATAAISVLPTVASLRALRTFRPQTTPSRPFLGIGDPILDGSGGVSRGVLRGVYRDAGMQADVSVVRQLSRLPETRDEINAIATALGADRKAMLIGERATEKRLRATDLAPYRLLSFATHGLVAGELQGLPEPALVLTPPDRASTADDGLLTASEIAELKLGAELVMLSACNTAAGDQPDGSGFGSLAQAFFYAGGRALMASHWPVASEATKRLTVAMFRQGDMPAGPAERLRLATAELMRDAEHPHYAHPAFWAPFVIIGEGGLPPP